MNLPKNWSQLTAETAGSLVSPAQTFRPGIKGILQYISGNREYISVNSTEPYGTETDHAFDTPRPAHLLGGIERSTDFATFRIPGEAMTLKAITRDAQRHNVRLLAPSYHNVGVMLGNLSTRPDVKAPLIHSDDIAVDRQTGEVLLIPPIDFGKRNHTAGDYSEAFVRSTRRDLRNLPADLVKIITDKITEGVQDGRRTT